MGCGASEILAGWVKCLRKKLNLCDKVIRGRRYHHDRFHAGGDSEHLYYLSVLAVWRAETENALQAVNRRHDEICGITSFDPEDLDDEEVAAVLDWDATPPSDVPASEDPYTDRFEEDQRRERSRLIERLFAFRKAALLHGDDTRSQFIDYMERLVILAIRERSGLRALLHGDAADVDEFLRQEIVTLEELKHIYVAVHVMSPRMVLGAIIDAFRPPQESHDAVLGRRIYREEYDGEICFTAWDLFEDVMPCRHCALQGCHRLEEWNKIDRLATLSLRFLNWQPENLTSFSRADTLFHLSGVFAERKWERFCPKPFLSAKHGKLYVEIQRPAGLYLKTLTTDFYKRSKLSATPFPYFRGPPHSQTTQARLSRARAPSSVPRASAWQSASKTCPTRRGTRTKRFWSAKCTRSTAIQIRKYCT
ncbi:hypothetical protein B0H19DRAFT_154875 [Mycena capillaripes]|nr:hypothetical protein B0H19DRAFT_154875 [Mycena capillaripes]